MEEKKDEAGKFVEQLMSETKEAQRNENERLMRVGTMAIIQNAEQTNSFRNLMLVSSIDVFQNNFERLALDLNSVLEQIKNPEQVLENLLSYYLPKKNLEIYFLAKEVQSTLNNIKDTIRNGSISKYIKDSGRKTDFLLEEEKYEIRREYVVTFEQYKDVFKRFVEVLLEQKRIDEADKIFLLKEVDKIALL